MADISTLLPLPLPPLRKKKTREREGREKETGKARARYLLEKARKSIRKAARTGP